MVSRALSKDVSKRYQTMSDFAADLARIQRGCQTGRAPPKPGWLSIRRLKARDKGNPSLPFRTPHKTQTKLHRPVYLTALTTALAAATFGVYSLPLRAWRDTGPPQRIVPFSSFPGLKDHASFSPDGSQVVFAWTGGKIRGGRHIYIQVIGSGEPCVSPAHQKMIGFPRGLPTAGTLLSCVA